MKISKILAGMSATAIAASMLTLAVSADAETEGTETAITSVSYNITVDGGQARFYNQYLGWYTNTVTLEEGTADYEANPNPDEEEADGFTNLGYVQSTKDTVNDKGETVPDTLEDDIWVTINSMTVNGYVFTLDGVDLDGTNNGYYNMWWAPETDGAFDLVSDDGKAKLVWSSSGITLVTYGESGDPVPAPEITYTEKVEGATDGKYAGDWGGSGFTPEGWDISNIKAEDGIKVTLTYTLEDVDSKEQPYTYWLAAPIDGHGWGKLYTEGYEPEDGTIAGVPLKSSFSAEELEAYADPVLQNDGYFVVKNPGVLEFTITEKGVKNILQNAIDNPGEDGGIWYQLGFQVYGLTITSATYEYNVNEVAPVDSSEESSEETSEETSETPVESSEAATESKKTADSSSKAATTATTTNPGTGAAALAVTGIALAGAAVVASKKRK